MRTSEKSNKCVMKQKWSEITIADYKQINEITSRELDSDLEKSVAYLAVLMNEDEDKLWSLTLPELNALLEQTKWLNSEFTFNKHPFKHIVINGEKYDVMVDIMKFTVAQYADFQIYWDHRTDPEWMAKLMTVFVIPRGKKYNDGYDAAALAETLENNLSITDFNSICFFFLLDLLNLTRGIALYSTWLTRKMRKNPKMKDNIETLQTLTKHII